MAGLGVDVSSLIHLSRENLRNILKEVHGEKDLILDPGFMKPLDVIAGMSFLKGVGVQKVFRLEKKKPMTAASRVRVYLIPPNLVSTKYIIDHYDNGSSNSNFHIIFIPRILHQVQRLLEEEGVIHRIVLHQYMWELLPLDYDILSLEMPSVSYSINIQNDFSLLPTVTKSVLSLQLLFGKIPNKIAVGTKGVTVLRQLEVFADSNKLEGNEFEYLFLFDRSLDYVSCLLSPVTYEALLDEVFAIESGVIELDSRITKCEKVAKLQLSNKDKMFEKIRNKHFSNIFSLLSIHTRQLKQHKNKASSILTVSEMKNFVKNNLLDIQNQSRAIALHISACEVIQKEKGPLYETSLPVEHQMIRGAYLKDAFSYIEDCIAQLFPITIVLRLMSILSIVQNGLPSTEWKFLTQHFLQAYGFSTISILKRLENIGLYNKRRDTNKTTFQQLCLKYNLIPKEEEVAGSPSYVFNGAYTPLVCKIISNVLQGDIIFEEEFPYKIIRKKGNNSKLALIFFIGGYTLAEVAALRNLQTLMGYKFVIAGTSNITGKKLMQQLGSLR